MKTVEEIFGIKTDNLKLFERALCHPSYTQENNMPYVENYERLEFLGDAVLKLCTSDILFKKYPDYQEGDMTKIRSIIVSDNTLAKHCKEIGLNELIVVGSSQEKHGDKNLNSICACVFEAILGAYYLDGKEKEIFEYLRFHLDKYITEVDAHFDQYNAKAVLQEYMQGKSKKLPEYVLIKKTGPAHDMIFTMSVICENQVLATGEGRTKKEAEQKCALTACQNLKLIK